MFLRPLLRRMDRVVPGVARALGWETLLAGLSFPASILLNRALGAEQRGLLAVVLVIPTTIFTLGNCQWDRIARGAITSRTMSAREAWRRTLRYALPLTSVFVPLGIAASLFYPALTAEGRWLSALYTLNFPVYFLGGTLQTLFLANGHVEAQYRARLSMQGSYVLLLAMSLLAGNINLPMMIAIYLAIHVVSLAVAAAQRAWALSGAVEEGPPPYGPLVTALPPLIAESVAARADVWAFSAFGTLASMGQYSGISALMLPVGLVSNAMFSSSVARLDWTEGVAVRRYLRSASVVLLVLCVVVVSAAWLLGPTLLAWLLGKTFAVGSWMFPWVALALVLQATSQQFHASVQLSGFAAAFLRIQSFDAALRLAATFGLGWVWGERGVLVGLVLAPLVKSVLSGYAIAVRHRSQGVPDGERGDE